MAEVGRPPSPRRPRAAGALGPSRALAGPSRHPARGRARRPERGRYGRHDAGRRGHRQHLDRGGRGGQCRRRIGGAEAPLRASAAAGGVRIPLARRRPAHGAPVRLRGKAARSRWPGSDGARGRVGRGARQAAPGRFRDVFDEVGSELCRGLEATWNSSQHRMVADPAAARAARTEPHDPAHPIEAFVDFGGLTLQITVRVPAAPGRPRPFIAGSSMGYLLGGERFIDAAAFAGAALEPASGLRDAYRATARRWRGLIANGGHLRNGDGEAAAAFCDVVLQTAFSLLRRQLEGTLRRAAPDLRGLPGAGGRVYLLGEGWKLVALDTPDDEREEAALRALAAHLRKGPLLEDVEIDLQRMTKRRLCEGALRVHADEDSGEFPLELQGVDVVAADGRNQRWFGVAGSEGLAGPDLLPDPSDPWWGAFASRTDGSLLRVEQWFTSAAPFETSLSGGQISFDPARSLLKQWIDLSGPSLVALRIHGDLQGRRAAREG